MIGLVDVVVILVGWVVVALAAALHTTRSAGALVVLTTVFVAVGAVPDPRVAPAARLLVAVIYLILLMRYSWWLAGRTRLEHEIDLRLRRVMDLIRSAHQRWLLRHETGAVEDAERGRTEMLNACTNGIATLDSLVAPSEPWAVAIHRLRVYVVALSHAADVGTPAPSELHELSHEAYVAWELARTVGRGSNSSMPTPPT